ncbi:TIR domain-containing protein [Pseudomonas syringae]|uniref:nucleotide-binding protein n=1 Tax=Pseudomonas syringae TaxID=317 RepID=UPI00073687BB|nr:nucleotide-binding protein [Pseudomonas syringae]KTB77565.1 DNA-binding protein [Pseudomonas syringae pv. syringae PD2766]
MSKPRIFIGSSVEGLDISYAVQLNLTHEAEATVWTQGVFNLSQTTIESLNNALDESDFAVFVFSPDDLAQIRNSTKNTVRDNVLFEFGLFIGKLGRNRVFFLQPNKGDLHLPSDLLGVTPGKYDSERSDANLQAATGAACHQIAIQIKKLGQISTRSSVQTKKDGGTSETSEIDDWIDAFVDSRYSEAKVKLEIELSRQAGEELLTTQAWIKYCDFKLCNDGDILPLIKFSDDNLNSPLAQSNIASILKAEGYSDRAIQLLKDSCAIHPNNTKLITGIAECHKENGEIEQAIKALKDSNPEDNPEIAIYLSDLLELEKDEKSAIQIIQKCHAKNPSNEPLRFRYACLAQAANELHIALHLLDRLTHDYPKDITYWGHFGNACLNLELYDMALYGYREAEKLMDVEATSQWIVANIGNILNNKGFAREACKYFERALKYEPHSEYTHERLADALKNKAKERATFERHCTEGRRRARAAMTGKMLSNGK